jgi:ketosteroid isomerase-like protein
VIEKVESDGMALTLAEWRLAGTGPDGSPVELTGHGTIVSRRQPDGSWRILLDIPVRPT